MKQRFGVSATLVFGAVLACPLTMRARALPDSTEEGLTITVKVLNFAKVPRSTLEKGQAVASEIFRETGVELKWLNCPCEQSDLANFTLRIIPKLFGSTRSTFRSDHLGFAAVNEEGGELATVFYDRIESQTRGGDPSNLLGLAAAHELGHLLLGSKAHTDNGIMRPNWTRKDRRQVDRAGFRFTSEQSETMRQRAVKSLALANSQPAESIPLGLRVGTQP